MAVNLLTVRDSETRLQLRYLADVKSDKRTDPRVLSCKMKAESLGTERKVPQVEKMTHLCLNDFFKVIFTVSV